MLRIRNISHKICRENQNTHFVFSNFVFFSENRAFCEKMWKKNTVKRGRPQMTIWRIRIACQITKATNTHSEYVTLIPFPLQQWLHERASILLCVHYIVFYFYIVVHYTFVLKTRLFSGFPSFAKWSRYL